MTEEAVSEVVDAFVVRARRFCEFVEAPAAVPTRQRMITARELLLELYLAGTRLELVEPPEGVASPESPKPPEGWAGFDKFEMYWETFDPYVEDEPVVGSLSDDLLDIYRDLRRGLSLWDSPAPKNAAIWEWKFHFDAHWGDHAIDALRALHWSLS